MEPICKIKNLKTKTKSYGQEATDSYEKKVPKVGSNYTCLAAMSIDFVLKKGEN